MTGGPRTIRLMRALCLVVLGIVAGVLVSRAVGRAQPNPAPAGGACAACPLARSCEGARTESRSEP